MKSKAARVSNSIDNIRRIFQVLTEYSKKIEHETTLTGPQLWTLRILAEESQLKVSEIAKRMYLHPATMVGLIDRLEAKGLVVRERSSRDRRVVYVKLTPAGRVLVSNAPEVVQELLIKALEKQPDEKIQIISDGLQHIVKILNIADIPPQLIMSSEINFPKRRKKI